MSSNQDFLERERATTRLPYPTDLIDEEWAVLGWAVLEPLATRSASLVLDAVLYVLTGGRT